MNGLKTDNNGGHPAHLDDLRWIDQGIRQAFQAVMSPFGIDNQSAVILKGCSRSSNAGIITISEGYISIGGELCFVPSHSYSVAGNDEEYFYVKSDFDNSGLKQYQDNNLHDTYEIRIGEVKTVAQGNIPAGHTKYQDAKNVYQIINSKMDVIPVGTVLLWSGDIQNVPSGYALCDGANGTPDLRGRFVVGQDPRATDPNNQVWDSNYNNQGAVGGEKDHQLVVNELPPHSHLYGVNNSDETGQGGLQSPALVDAGGAITAGNAGFPLDKQVLSQQAGSGAKHNNVPPYYVLAYIIKTTVNVPQVI